MGCVTTEVNGEVGAKTDCWMSYMLHEKGQGHGVVDIINEDRCT